MTVPSPLLVPRRVHNAARPATPPAHQGPRLTTVEWLLTLNDADFRHQVTQDVRGVARPGISAGLRDPQVVTRWVGALRPMLTRVGRDLREREGRPGKAEWRDRAHLFRKHTITRLEEAERLLPAAGDGGAR